MDTFERIYAGEASISIIGLGYVGLPLAVELAKKYNVVGYDNNLSKIQSYQNGIDLTSEVGDQEIVESTMLFTHKESELSLCAIHIICVPTPINQDKTPNLTPIIEASKTVGRNLKQNSIVVFESTVYPGTTEEICIPILEQESGLLFGIDFEVGYSPERINPGDKVHRLTNISKIVSGSRPEVTDILAKLYGSIINAEIYKAPSIKVAEAAKVIENSQRDINIAFMNELAMVFNKMDISTHEVLKAAKTKWNFMDFKPGLVGGHCIGVDPYYFLYKAKQLGHHSQIIAAGRNVNDNMGNYVASCVIKQMIKLKMDIQHSKIAVFGLAFKENCGDIRNSKVIDIIKELDEYQVDMVISDPIVSASDAQKEYGIHLSNMNEITDVDVIILAVPHNEFIHEFSQNHYKSLFKTTTKLVVDIKSALDANVCHEHGLNYWSL